MKILAYTDSRGKRIGTYQNHDHYLDRLIKDGHDVKRFMCTEKWTTTLDFLRDIDPKTYTDYDYIILHTSVVDNSPRNAKDALNKIYLDPKKKPIFDKVFGETAMKNHLANHFNTKYENVYTNNMYSKQMAIEKLLPILEKIPNLIWITNSPLVNGNGKGWRGTYFRERPENMQIVNDYSKSYLPYLKNTKVVNLTDWTDTEIKAYTVDNIHFSEKGSDLVYDKLIELMV